jgi:hypothetical protein
VFGGEGTLFVRNQRPDDIKIRFEPDRRALEVRAGTTKAFSGFVCDATAIVALDAAEQKELARLGPICHMATWTVTPDGASLADGAPPAG